MGRVKILDCTLRDGGYYNEWEFTPDLARELVQALSKSGVDIVEVGYKSLAQEKYYGLFKYCAESQLQFLKDFPSVEFAFMLDAKEFSLPDGSINLGSLNRCVRPRELSVFSWCRIASHFSTVPQAVEIAKVLAERGYRTTFNIMGISLLQDEQIVSCLKALEGAPIDVFYFADSFGSMDPAYVTRVIKLIRSHFKGAIGIHTHDNQGLAFANALAALEVGVEYVDATVTGMGRGAGNLRLEQLLLALYFRAERKELNAYALLDVIQKHFVPLQQNFRWGWDFSYMLSGIMDIHPSYCQKLKSNHQYTMLQVAEILAGIPTPSRNKFSPNQLEETSNAVLRAASAMAASVEVPTHEPKLQDSILVVAAGPSLSKHQSALRAFIERTRPLVIECNHTGVLGGIPRQIAVLNQVRLAELLAAGIGSEVDKVIIGNEMVPGGASSERLAYIRCEIQSAALSMTGNRVTIPGFIVGMFALSVGLLSKPQRIYLAGFDGFTQKENQEQQREMESFWSLAKSQAALQGCELISLLPTNYSLPSRSVYQFLD